MSHRAKLLAASLCVSACVLSSASAQTAHLRATASSAVPQQKRQLYEESAASAAAAAVPVTGTFVAKFTIKLVTPVPSGYELLCALTATSFEENTTTGAINNEIEEAASAKATVSGSTATCTTTIPYSWTLSTPSTDTVSLSYSLSILNPTGTNNAAETRTSTQFVPGAGSIKVPSSGATTTYTINATL